MARHSAKHSKPASSRVRLPRVNWIAAVGVIAVCALIFVFGAYAARGGFRARAEVPRSATEQPVSAKASIATAESTSTPVEVPVLVGLKLDEAKMVLNAASLCVVVRREPAGRSAEPTISAQEPVAGSLAKAGSFVTVALPGELSVKKADAKAKSKRAAYVVCIDPGHQSHSDSKTEPIGPGSAVRKPRITGGTTGAFTSAPEYETVLQIATNLKRRLEAAGVTVVMTRTTNDVNISNAERAQLANAAGADLVVRLHADSNTDEKVSGISTLYPSSTAWTKPIVERSRRAAGVMQAAVVKTTHAVDLAIAERGDLAGFNWSSVPTVLVAVGVPSNPVEDRLLVSPHYQDQIAQGLADGTLTYLKGDH